MPPENDYQSITYRQPELLKKTATKISRESKNKSVAGIRRGSNMRSYLESFDSMVAIEECMSSRKLAKKDRSSKQTSIASSVKRPKKKKRYRVEKNNKD